MTESQKSLDNRQNKGNIEFAEGAKDHWTCTENRIVRYAWYQLVRRLFNRLRKRWKSLGAGENFCSDALQNRQQTRLPELGNL